MRILLACSLFALGSCSSGASPGAIDSGATIDLAGGSPVDGSVAADLSTPTGLDGAAPLADLTWLPSMPSPPAGANKCGHGMFTATDSRTACMAPSFILDNWGMAQMPFPRACDAVAMTGGEWDVWCTATQAYVFVHYAALRPTGTLMCKGTTGLLLGAVYDSGSGGGDTGDNMMDGYTGVPSPEFDVNMPIEAYEWITTDVKSKAATLWLAPTSLLLGGSCGSMNSGYRSIAAGAQVTWMP